MTVQLISSTGPPPGQAIDRSATGQPTGLRTDAAAPGPAVEPGSRPTARRATGLPTLGGQVDGGRPLDDVINRFRAGDEAAIRTLYQRHGGAVFTVARSVTGDRELASEVVQQTFTKAWQAADRFDPARPIAPWLYAIARRTAIDVLRHERRPTTGGHAAETDPGVPGPSFERTWEIHEVRTAIDGLPADEREVVRLSHLAGLSHPEIAERLGIPVGTVKSRSSRAHRRLAAALRHLSTEREGGR